ncbi:hypothetical protein NDK47_08615 [Brevibacillus ruminantium]|uniref:Uncharacterized protein n=1 Tax=Brevibacillus ruminantium TaxID=2950604 RepID=A0ABY4WJL4_9BACL|nr:hypothetical protein [Brevibacillus ruminantium]USG67320.1 hypothetical protein NDK47_08615 [Brevibacillus ruminantium]
MGQREDWPHQEEESQMKAEFPENGTPLNPVEEPWAFADSAAASVENLAESMQQGE